MRPTLHLLQALGLVMLAWTTGAFALDLQGHRGARGLAPENTLAAFERALRIGVSTLELDVGVTADGVVVVSHDPVLNPDLVRGPDGRWVTGTTVLNRLTHDQLRQYDVGRLRPGSAYAAAFPQQEPVDGARMPTLAQVLQLARQLEAGHVRFNIETKLDLREPGNTPAPEAFAQAVLRVVREAGVEQRVTVQSFDWRSLQAVQRLAPHIRTAYLSTQSARFTNVETPDWTAGFTQAKHGSVPAMVKAAGGLTWSPNHQALDAAGMRQARDLGLQVVPWTANEPADIERLLDLGVDGIISDYPDRVRAALQRRGLPLPPAIR